MSDRSPPPGQRPAEEPPRRRHLLDPDAPRPRTSRADIERLEGVQRWVLSVLVVTTIGHLAVGLVLAALYVTPDNRTAQVGLCLIAGICGALGVASGFAIHRRSLISPWLVLGLIPGLVGWWLVLR